MSATRPHPGPRPVRLLVAATLAVVLVAAATSCTADPAGPSSLTPTPSAAATTPASASPSITEPTTTNTLPPPPDPTAPAPSTAGALNAASLPVPSGWRTAVLPGGEEEGYRGNGTWVHGRDPRYAAQDVVTIGCADVTRDDYTDPTAALEGNYVKGDETGIGLALDFGDVDAAQRYFSLYVAQVRACAEPGQDVRTSAVTTPTAADGGQGLVDRRTYSDGTAWTEVGELNGSRLTLVILGDPGHRISAAATAGILEQVRP